jgi:hypothetical protein
MAMQHKKPMPNFKQTVINFLQNRRLQEFRLLLQCQTTMLHVSTNLKNLGREIR